MKLNAWKEFFLAAACTGLLLAGCAGRIRTATTHTVSFRQTGRNDTAILQRRAYIASSALPAEHARLVIPLDSIRQLPAGALYAHKTGRATASLRFRTDTLYLYASCDSLQTLLYGYEEEIRRLQTRTDTLQNDDRQVKEKKTTTASWPILPLWLFPVFGCVCWYLFRKKK